MTEEETDEEVEAEETDEKRRNKNRIYSGVYFENDIQNRSGFKYLPRNHGNEWRS